MAKSPTSCGISWAATATAVVTPSGIDVMTADEHRNDAAFMHLAVVGVAVTPEHELLEDEKQQDAEQEGGEDPRRRQLLKRGRQQRQH